MILKFQTFSNINPLLVEGNHLPLGPAVSSESDSKLSCQVVITER
jgi:hypothetical protein